MKLNHDIGGHMKKFLGIILGTLLVSLSFSPLLADQTPNTVYSFKMKNIDGKTVSLAKYKGKVLLIVNVASKCGHTPQYAGLEKLYEKYKNKGFVILCFPCNQFREQEPGTDADIKAFCTAQYNVTLYCAVQKALISASVPGSCSRNWLQGKHKITNPLFLYFS